MYTENDLVNAFIKKQADTIGELINKSMMLEVKLSLTEKAMVEWRAKAEDLQKKLDILQPKEAPRPNSPEGKEHQRRKSELLTGNNESQF